MGNGRLPGPERGVGASTDIDDGTLPRIDTPPPGTIGLDAPARGGGSGRQAQPSLGERVVSFARQRVGQVYGNGECFTLADAALRHAGARSAADFGQVHPDADYVWGTSVSRTDLRAGDIVQMRDFRVDKETVTRHPNGGEDTSTEFEERPHHTAIVESVGSNGMITVLEQNHPEGTGVTRNTIPLIDSEASSGSTRVTYRVSGTLWFYRPQSR